MRPGFAIYAVASPENPKAFARFVLDDKVVPDCGPLGCSLPPLAEYSFGTIGAFHLAAFATPCDGNGRMVGHQCDDLDQFRVSEQSYRTRPVMRPGGDNVICNRCNPLNAALGNIGGNGCETIDALTTIAEDVDERSDVRDLIFDKRRRLLCFLKRLNHDRRKGKLLDPEARIDLLGHVAKQFRQPGDIAGGLCRSCPQRLGCVVDLVDDKIDTANTQTLFLELAAKFDDQTTDIFVDRFGCPDRLLENAADFDQFGRADGVDGFADAPENLVKAAGNFRAEAQCQRCPRRRRKLTDGSKAERSQIADDLFRQTQQGNRQSLDRFYGFTPRHDHCLSGDGTCASMSGTPCVGNGNTGRQPPAPKAIGNPRQHGKLSAPEMVGTICVHDDAIRRIDCDDRRVLAQCPEGNALQRFGVRLRIGIDHHQSLKQSLCLCSLHADTQTCLFSWSICRRYPAFRSGFCDHGDGLFSRNAGIGATNAIRRQIRKVDRYDPGHHTLQR